MKKLKIIRKTYKNDNIEVHDIEVKDAHHYILRNGILSHNSIGGFIPEDVMSGGGGPLYNASVITFLYKSQLKEDKPKGERDVDMKQTGIIVRSKPKKNRFARPIQIRFHISFYKGMNPYVGLEEFISWDACGIERGHILDKKAISKLTSDELDKAKKNNWLFEFDGEQKCFWPKPTARKFVVRHLCETIEPGKLFTPEIITDEVIQELDEKVIKPTFTLPDVDDIYNVEDFASEIFEEKEEDNNE